MSASGAGALVNLLGFATATALYAMLLALVVRSRARRQNTPDMLPMATAVLGLIWNVGALAIYGLRGAGGSSAPSAFVVALAFAALGFLPAVVVHSVARGRTRGRVVLTWSAYAVSTFGALQQIDAAAQGHPLPDAGALATLSWGFVTLMAALLWASRAQPGWRRALWMTSLAVFAVSALHIGQRHSTADPWPIELLGHHASLPLALAILYQDYPFALADLFLKRALAVVGLLVVTVALALGVTQVIGPPADGSPLSLVTLVALSMATAFLYPPLSRGAAWLVDDIILRRPDYDDLRARFARMAADQESPEAILDAAVRVVAPALCAGDVRWVSRSDDAPPEGAADELVLVGSRGVSAIAKVQTTEPPTYTIVVDALSGGRRILSDDVDLLDAIVRSAARRIDSLRMARERYARAAREREMARLATEAELKALRAQLNPHFLFNALTTLGYLIQTSPPRALQTLLRLTDLLRRVLRSDGEFTTLGKELELVDAYLDIERPRLEERLEVSLAVPASLRAARIPTLLLQPLVENAVRHGIAPRRGGGRIAITASRRDRDGRTPLLELQVEDTGAGMDPARLAAVERLDSGGVGVRNVAERLRACYGRDATIAFDSLPDLGTIVRIRLPLRRVPIAAEQRTPA
jgi:two-component system, LytTR family, sensor kinase